MKSSQFEQSKLTKHEWQLIEGRITDNESRLLEFIEHGYDNIDITVPACATVLSLTKLERSACIEAHIYAIYLLPALQKAINTITESINLPELTIKDGEWSGLKTKDRIRIENTNSIIKANKDSILELVLIGIVKRISKKMRKRDSSWMNYLYTIAQLLNGNCQHCNPYLASKLLDITSALEKEADLSIILRNGSELIEGNDILLRYTDLNLYEHQKRLFSVFRNTDTSRLVFYVAPTGTGKTLSPLGLLKQYKIVFVCAARHVGLAIAKAAVNRDRGVGFAFGCENDGDIKLHYGAAVVFERDHRSGGIKRVDNSKGEKVELMVTDLKSYPIAMRYMLKFSEKENLVMYWDEPTISLDYERHECHDLVSQVWRENQIPNIVMASATLPSENDLGPTKTSFADRFEGKCYNITSHDCKKSITLVDRKGEIIMPHSISKHHSEVTQIASRFVENPTHQRYLDTKTLCEFLIQSHKILEKPFPYLNLKQITMSNLKSLYLTQLRDLTNEDWKVLDRAGILSVKQLYESGIYLSTRDAITLTGGPTIYLAKDVNKIGKFLLQNSNISTNILASLERTMQHNSRVAEKHKTLMMKLADLQAGDIAAKRTNKLSDESRDSEVVKNIKAKMASFEKSFKKLELPSRFIPNSPSHLLAHHSSDKSLNTDSHRRPFTTTLTSADVSEIITKEGIAADRKILLLMGIGIFDDDQSSSYSILMKKFAIDQKLFLVVASSDYIYGTNYQFSHGYLGKDVNGITRSKIIQAMGRVGRNTSQQLFTFRFRSDSHIDVLFGSDENSIEADNFKRLLS